MSQSSKKSSSCEDVIEEKGPKFARMTGESQLLLKFTSYDGQQLRTFHNPNFGVPRDLLGIIGKREERSVFPTHECNEFQT